MVEYEWTEALCRTYAENIRQAVRFDHRPWARKISAKMGALPEGSAILDVASGPGFLLLELAKLRPGARLLAHDLSEYMHKIQVEEAAKLNLEVETVSGPAEGIELEDDQVQVVTCKQLLHECQDVDQVMVELLRVLKPGGKAYIIDFDQEGFRLSAHLIRVFMWFKMGREISRNYWKSYKGGLKGSDAQARMEAAGFKEVSLERSGPNYLLIGVKP